MLKGMDFFYKGGEGKTPGGLFILRWGKKLEKFRLAKHHRLGLAYFSTDLLDNFLEREGFFKVFYI